MVGEREGVTKNYLYYLGSLSLELKRWKKGNVLLSSASFISIERVEIIRISSRGIDTHCGEPHPLYTITARGSEITSETLPVVVEGEIRHRELSYPFH